MANVGAKGIDVKVLQNWDLAKEAIIGSALKGQRLLAANILGASQEEVPVDTGTLLRSGAISTDEQTLTTTISYNTPYARRVHEEHTSKAKYLERPFNEKAGELQHFVEDEIANTLIKTKYSEKAAFNEKFPDLNYEDYKHLL